MKSQSWESYEKNKGPLHLSMKVFVLLVILTIFFGAASYVFGWFREGAEVMQTELGPKALLKKYVWFKDTAQRLQAQHANIETFEADLQATRGDYPDLSKAPRDVRESIEQHRAEIRGLKAAFNGLAAEYNANVRKVNWRAMNTESLPSEFTSYVTE